MWTVTNITRHQAILASNTREAFTLLRRVIGLLGQDSLASGKGLWIKPCNSIHSIGMRFSFDAIFLNQELRVVHLIEFMKPWRLSRIVGSATSVLELPAGTIVETKTQLEDQLKFTHSPNDPKCCSKNKSQYC